MTRLVYWFAYALFLLTAIGGCATTKAVGTIAKSCEPTTDQEMALLDAAAKPTQLEALAAIDALGFVLCVLQLGADEAIASLQPKPGTTALALSAASYSPVVDNLKEWRKRHP